MTTGVSLLTTLCSATLMMVVLSALFTTASAKECYICNSTLDHNCQEMFDHSLSVAKDKIQVCDMWDAKYCIKVTGLWGGVVGTHRFCSSRDLGYQCQDIWYPDHDRMYRACIYSCTRDNCNAASRMSVTAVTAVVAAWVMYQLQRLLH